MGKNVKTEKKAIIPRQTTEQREQSIIEANNSVEVPKDLENSAVLKFLSSESNKNSMVYIKKMRLGNKEITAEFHSKVKKRPNYYISEETTELVDAISSYLGYPKSEFVDVYLNHGLKKVLKDLQNQQNR